MFWSQKPQNELRNELESLRTQLRDHVRDYDALSRRVEKLESERYSRETELSDLRTRFETLIKRISARVDNPSQHREDKLTAHELRSRLGR